MREEELPNGWARAALGDFLIERGQGINPATASDEEFELYSVPSFDTGHTELLTGAEIGSSKQIVEPNTVLICKINPRINRAWRVREASGRRQIASTEWICFPPSDAIEPAYLQLYLSRETIRAFLALNVSGVGGSLMRVRPSTLAPYPLPVAPLNEQRRIVERIDELFSQIEAGETAFARAKRLLARYRQAVLKAAVTGELTKDWRERHASAHGSHTLHQMLDARGQAASAAGRTTTKRHHIPEENKFPVPDTWAWCSIEDAGHVQLGQQRAPQHHSGDHMRPYLRVANVLENKLDLSDVKTMNFMPSELEKFELRPGDILLNEGQSPDKLGRSAIYNGEIEGCCVQKTLLRFRAYSGLAPRFAQIVFRFYMNFERFKRIARITTNIGHLTRVRFVEMEFPVPPTEEQQLIADRFDALDTNIDALLEAVPTSFSAALRQAILTAAFAGKLVPQDPADEPAASLLHRISAERPTTPATRPRRGRPAKSAVIAAQ